LSEARKNIDNAARQKAEVDVKVARLREDLEEYRNRFVFSLFYVWSIYEYLGTTKFNVVENQTVNTSPTTQT
jgi:hypothetical protein